MLAYAGQLTSPKMVGLPYTLATLGNGLHMGQVSAYWAYVFPPRWKY